MTGRRKRREGPRLCGEDNPNAALTNEAARNLRVLRANGWTHADLAAMYGISVTRSSAICKGRTYREAGGPIEEGPRVYNVSILTRTDSMDELRARVVELRETRGLTERAIAAEVRKSKTFVHDTLKARRG